MTVEIGINGLPFDSDNPGGAIQAAKQLTMALIECEDIKVTLFGSTSVQGKFDLSPSKSIFLNTLSNKYTRPVLERTAIPYLANKMNLDGLLYLNGNSPPFNVSVSVIMYLHDLSGLKGWSTKKHQLYCRTTIPPAVSAADGLVTVSQFSKDEINEVFDRSESVYVVPNGVDEFYFQSNNSKPIDIPKKYILYVGAMNPRKNVNRITKSFQDLVLNENIDYKLIMVGPRNDTIFKDINPVASNNIIIYDYVNKAELKYLYQQAEFLMYPSLYEGFGLPPLEAMACGTPVLTSNIRPFTDILEDSALLVDPNSVSEIRRGMEKLIDNNHLQEKLMNAGHSLSTEYRWNNSAAQLRNAIYDIIDS